MDRTALLWHQLNILTKERYDAILQVFASLEEAAAHLNEDFLKGLGCREETILRVLMEKEEFDGAQLEAEFEKYGVTFLTIDDEAYPKKLKEIPDPPVFLTYRGDLSILNEPCIGLVGTREMGKYGQRVTQDFVPDFVQAGMVTVSGLALGIDAEVAKETLKAGGKTVAALGHGLRSIYPPANAALGEKIVDSGGLLLSEFPLHMEPTKFSFPARNRIIAGLSVATVVLEAPEKSGALITANLSLDYNRDVFAVPGLIFDANYAGCNTLIAKGHAKLVTSARDVLKEIGVVVPEAREMTVYEPQNDDEKKLLSALTTMPQPVDDLVEKTKLPPSAVGAALTMMELSGAVRQVGGGTWVRS